ncbi:hypothetical protein EMIHUDRAFT_460370 [Emiliania huxleyi CCMP1516]|uniref:Septin-type G domain-containing protein n=2 Tax=Emiliania huxleyi TaxID=2903 RepID=A0A0D3KWU6_EMIH1|nr:hypothetical protein EMIHUDRAFT_460370 [Emiliania huxleyi CCMP1516]EOD40231.1 hypothetical protein EMIHUDRAFT_460370 [Emiliania huxleyi CCMP1516]|eukprot:XP_005792660.1 hypothetical protein EMIHUDRAFT_460370 [Emiliania huxleyi CCMP1516]
MQSVASSFVSEAGPDGGWDLEPTEWDQSGMGSSTLVVDDEDSSGRSGFVTEQHNLVPHGVIGAEYRSLKASANGAVGIASLPTPQRDPYHGRCVEPRTSREPGRESFNLMVVGEAGLGKTTLLESFFKSFRDEDATSALFERKETQKVIETRRLLEDAGTRRDTRDIAERAMKAAAETGKYKEARGASCEQRLFTPAAVSRQVQGGQAVRGGDRPPQPRDGLAVRRAQGAPRRRREAARRAPDAARERESHADGDEAGGGRARLRAGRREAGRGGGAAA